MATLHGNKVARRYARALFDIGVEHGTFESLGRELDDVVRLFGESADLRQALENPGVRGQERRAVLQAVLARIAPTRVVQGFLLLLLERTRLPALPAIARAYGEMCDLRLGRVRARVVSARPLDEAGRLEVRRALERRTGKEVVLEASVDPEIIGGVVVEVAGTVLDGSLRARLSGMKSRILN